MASSGARREAAGLQVLRLPSGRDNREGGRAPRHDEQRKRCRAGESLRSIPAQKSPDPAVLVCPYHEQVDRLIDLSRVT